MMLLTVVFVTQVVRSGGSVLLLLIIMQRLISSWSWKPWLWFVLWLWAKEESPGAPTQCTSCRGRTRSPRWSPWSRRPWWCLQLSWWWYFSWCWRGRVLILCAQGGFEMPIGGQLCNPARITRIVRYPDHDDDDDDHFCYDSNVDKNDQLSNLVIRITRTVG